jgi:hypothetical protein
MKRSSSAMSSSAPNSSDTEDFKPDVNPVSPLKTSKTPPKTPSPAKKAKKSSGGGGANNGEWTPEKKAVFMDRVVGSGYKNLDLGALSEEVSLFNCLCWSNWCLMNVSLD